MSARAASWSFLRPAGRALRKRLGFLWLAAVIVVSAAFLLTHRNDVGQAVNVLRTAPSGWLVLGLAVVLVIHGCYGLVIALWLRRLGTGLPPIRFIRAYQERLIAMTVSPIPGAGAVPLLRATRARGASTGETLLALSLAGFVGYASFVALLVPVLVLLEFEHRASYAALGAAGLLAAGMIVAGIAFAILLRPAPPPRWLAGRLPDRVLTFIASVKRHEIGMRDLVVPSIVALGADLGGVALLFIALRAAGQPASLREAAGAYAVGTLFLLVAPIFQGLGIVEASTAVVLTQFGVPVESALAAVLVYRTAEIWLPFAAALALRAGTDPHVLRHSFRVPALMTLLAGCVSVVSVIAPHFYGQRIRSYEPFAAAGVSRSFVVVTGGLLIYLSFNLWKRKRAAWIAACITLAASIPAHALKDHDGGAWILAAFALALLLLNAPRFNVRSDVPSVSVGLLQFGGAVLFALGYGIAGFYFLSERAFGHDFNLEESIRRTLRAYFLLGDVGVSPRTHYAHWFLHSLGIIGIGSAAFAAFSLARPVVSRRRASERERQRARGLVEQWGRSSQDFFKYSADKRFFFSPDGNGVVSYGVTGATAIALGDPVAGDGEEFAKTLGAFLAFCERNDWAPAFHQATPEYLAAYQGAGLHWIKIGEEAIVDLDGFTLAGGRMKSLRANANRLERLGFHTNRYEAPLGEDVLAALSEVSRSWLGQGRRERGFTLGTFDDAYVRSTDVFTVESEAGDIVAFANLIPDGVPGEATIDLMRHTEEAPGAMEYLFVRMFEALKDEGQHRFSLGMAPLANVGAEAGSTMTERALRQLYEHGDRIFSYKGMVGFKEKFHPAWEPRYLVYADDLALPRIALAIGRLTG